MDGESEPWPDEAEMNRRARARCSWQQRIENACGRIPSNACPLDGCFACHLNAIADEGAVRHRALLARRPAPAASPGPTEQDQGGGHGRA